MCVCLSSRLADTCEAAGSKHICTQPSVQRATESVWYILQLERVIDRTVDGSRMLLRLHGIQHE